MGAPGPGGGSCAGVRPRGDGCDAGRPRRRYPGEPNAGGWNVAAGHRCLGKAQRRRDGTGVGRGPVRAMRPVQFRMSAWRDPGKVFRRRAARQRAWQFSRRADQCARISRCTVCTRLRHRGLHRLRAVRRSVPGGAGKALIMRDKTPLLAASREDNAFFAALPMNDRARVDFANVRGVQFLEPLFAYSGACAGCGETPYLKLLSQLFGDRLQIANATGCSSIYGGNLPVTPWSTNGEGRGPAWSNSLFEDNAEFGLGFRLAADKHLEMAQSLTREMAPALGADLVSAALNAPQVNESDIRLQHERVGELKRRLHALNDPHAKDLLSVIEQLVRRSIWIVGGGGWAYDIGYGGLDHVLASARDINVLVLDTEVYSNTGGQASKATPLGAIAKFASAGKRVARKDLALQSIAYGNVYVAQVAMGANPQQTLQAFREAEAYSGPSLILAYSHCIAHGIDMQFGMRQQDRAVASGYWPLFRYNPAMRDVEANPFVLDSPRPRIPLKAYAYKELRYSSLANTRPDEADALLVMAQAAVAEKYRQYEELAGREGTRFHPDARMAGNDDPSARQKKTRLVRG